MLDSTKPDDNVIDAAARGTTDGLHLALNVAAMLIAFLSLVALVQPRCSAASATWSTSG